MRDDTSPPLFPSSSTILVDQRRKKRKRKGRKPSRLRKSRETL
jgi:hypothetical protein